MGDYIKISRKILEWGWYKDEHTKSLFFHCLLMANWKEGEFKGVTIKRGQFATTISKLEVELELTSNEIRTAIKHLKSTGEITVRTYAKFSVFTVVKYELYQCKSQVESQADNKQITNESHSINNLLTTIEEGKKEINNNIYIRTHEEKPTRFDEFWEIYPRKNNMLNAQGEYIHLLETTDSLSEEDLLAATRNYAESCKIRNTKEQYIKSPENWLKESIWIDYLPENYKKLEIVNKNQKSQKSQKSNRFNNCQNREYEFGDLERKLLGI